MRSFIFISVCFFCFFTSLGAAVQRAGTLDPTSLGDSFVVNYFKELHAEAERFADHVAKELKKERVKDIVLEAYEKVVHCRLEQQMRRRISGELNRKELEALADLFYSMGSGEGVSSENSPRNLFKEIVESLNDICSFKDILIASLEMLLEEEGTSAPLAKEIYILSDEEKAYITSSPVKTVAEGVLGEILEGLIDPVAVIMLDTLLITENQLGDFKKFFRKNLESAYNKPLVIQMITASYYADSFSGEELQKIAAFYKNEPGKKIGPKLGKIYFELLPQNVDEKLLKTWLEEVNKSLRRQGIKANILSVAEVVGKGVILLKTKRGIDSEQLFSF